MVEIGSCQSYDTYYSDFSLKSFSATLSFRFPLGDDDDDDDDGDDDVDGDVDAKVVDPT
jgi:hypothetical protein